MTLERFIMKQVANGIEDGAVKHRVTSLDDGVADSLGNVTLANSGRSHKQDVRGFANEGSGGQVEYLLSLT